MSRVTLFPNLLLCAALSGIGVAHAERFQSLPVESRQAGDARYQPVPAQPAQVVQQPIVPSNVQWELYSQIQQMQDELQRLRGLVEEQAHQIDQINRQQRERYIDLDQRINRLSESGAGQTAGSPHSTSAPAPSSSLDEKATYDQAISWMRERRFEDSIRLLENLLVAHPQGSYAGNAQYWLGELYMALTPRQLDAAKGHFVRLLSQFPDHGKVPDALFKLGSVYQQEGESQRAKVTFQKLIKEYPNHQSTRLARDAMGRL